jgi:hypothetical protein
VWRVHHLGGVARVKEGVVVAQPRREIGEHGGSSLGCDDGSGVGRDGRPAGLPGVERAEARVERGKIRGAVHDAAGSFTVYTLPV